MKNSSFIMFSACFLCYTEYETGNCTSQVSTTSVRYVVEWYTWQ